MANPRSENASSNPRSENAPGNPRSENAPGNPRSENAPGNPRSENASRSPRNQNASATDAAELQRAARKLLSDPWWRLYHLYKIVDKNGNVIQFKPNDAQRKLLEDMHTRNVVPKARQRGLSTIIQIYMLDCALFTPNFKGKVIAQDLDVAEEIFRDKLKFAYDNLPEEIRADIPLVRSTTSELCFANGSSVAVTTSARAGTVQFLHVSEFGKIAAKTPDKAREVLLGSIPAVPKTGTIFVESTAEGQDGEFYELVQRAMRMRDAKLPLSTLDFKMHFFSWWDAPDYRIDPAGIVIETKDNEYFNALELRLSKELGRRIEIDRTRRAWYVKTREALGTDAQAKMWQEYPSTVEECFEVSTEGAYYTEQMRKVRSEGRITTVPYDTAYPVQTYWDIGGGKADATAVWCIQLIGHRINVINFIEAYGEPYNYFVSWLKEQRYVWDTHFLPHDATHPRQQGLRNTTAQEMIQELAPGWQTQIVPRIPEIVVGINQTRDIFPRVWFDAEHCAEGIRHLDNYRKEWDNQRSVWKATPRHDEHSHCADAFRQIGQAIAKGRAESNSRKQPARAIKKSGRIYA